MRRAFIAGNWKMHLSRDQAVELARQVKKVADELPQLDVAVAPPFVWLEAVGRELAGSRVGLAAQNCHSEKSGAFTGEVAAEMLAESGCRYVILGHSERRQFFAETDGFINQKVAAVLRANLEPILCLGERLEERDAGQTLKVVEKQLRGSLAGISAEQMKRVTIAYEPVWAIGTGRTATPAQAQEVHAHLRSLLRGLFGEERAGTVRIQYGGSVKADNIRELMACPDIDGALVGGASLKADSFAGILRFG
jgi:triosephosphate isomerase